MRTSFMHLTVDTVVFGYQSNTISVLLIKRKNEPFKDQWAIPGGFVDENEPLATAAKRELREETSLDLKSVQQLYTFGAPERDPRGRIVSVVYFGLIKRDQYMIKAADDAKEVRWFGLDQLPLLAFDHKLILETAVDNLVLQLKCDPQINSWMDEKSGFTQIELNSVRQSIEARMK